VSGRVTNVLIGYQGGHILRRGRRSAYDASLGRRLLKQITVVAQNLRLVCARLARIPGNGSLGSAPHPGHDSGLLADDTPEKAEADRRVIGAWERAHSTPDIKGAAEQVRARLAERSR